MSVAMGRLAASSRSCRWAAGFPRQLATMSALGLRRMCKQSVSLEELLTVHRKHEKSFTPYTLGPWWISAVDISRRKESELVWAREHASEFAPVRRTTLRLAPELKAPDLSFIVASIAFLGVGRDATWASLWDTLEASATEKAFDMKVEGLVHLVWGLAKVDRMASPVHAAVAKEMVLELQGKRPVAPSLLAKLSWSLGKVQYKGPELTPLMGQIARRSIEQLDAFSPSELARLMRGYGRLKVQLDALTEAVGKRIIDMPSKPTVDASLLLSFAELGHDDLSLYETVIRRAMSNLPSADNLALRSLAGALAVMPATRDIERQQACCLEFYAALSHELLTRMQTLRPRDVAELSKSLLNAHSHQRSALHAAVHEGLLERAEAIVDDFNTKELVKVVNAAGETGFGSTAFLYKACDLVIPNMSSLQISEITTFLLGLSSTRCPFPLQHEEELDVQIRSRIGEMSDKQKYEIARSMTRMHLLPPFQHEESDAAAFQEDDRRGVSGDGAYALMRGDI